MHGRGGGREGIGRRRYGYDVVASLQPNLTIGGCEHGSASRLQAGEQQRYWGKWEKRQGKEHAGEDDPPYIWPAWW